MAWGLPMYTEKIKRIKGYKCYFCKKEMDVNNGSASLDELNQGFHANCSVNKKEKNKDLEIILKQLL